MNDIKLKELSEICTYIMGETVIFLNKAAHCEGEMSAGAGGPFSLIQRAAENISINASGIMTLLRAVIDINADAESKEATKQ